MTRVKTISFQVAKIIAEICSLRGADAGDSMRAHLGKKFARALGCKLQIKLLSVAHAHGLAGIKFFKNRLLLRVADM